MKAHLQYHRKITVAHTKSLETGICELKVWNLKPSSDYPEGIKFSLLLVSRTTGEVLIGIDNHKPKGPHLHHGTKELKYEFIDVERLVEDFWDCVKKEGFEL